MNTSSRLTPDCAQTFAVFLFVAVEGRGIEMAVTNLQRCLDRLHTDVLFQGHGAETDLRNTGAMGFNDLHYILLGTGRWRVAENAPSPQRCQPGFPKPAWRIGRLVRQKRRKIFTLAQRATNTLTASFVTLAYIGIIQD